MKIISAEFVTSAVRSAQYPKDGLPEVALIGRSNVGKSSLINALVNRKGLAKTSSTPGKTRIINFYRINNSFYFVDLPGFGYAKVSVSEKKDWERMTVTYLKERETLAGALVILDPRRDAGDMEEFLFKWVSGLRLPVITVFTKIDKLSRNQLSSRVALIKRAIFIDHPVLFSSVTGEGKLALMRKVEEIIGPEAGA